MRHDDKLPYPKLGPRQLAILQYIQANPGCSVLGAVRGGGDGMTSHRHTMRRYRDQVISWVDIERWVEDRNEGDTRKDGSKIRHLHITPRGIEVVAANRLGKTWEPGDPVDEQWFSGSGPATDPFHGLPG